MEKYENIKRRYETDYPDSYVVGYVMVLLEKILERKDEYPDRMAIGGIIVFKHLRELSGFYLHQDVMHSILSLIVGWLTGDSMMKEGVEGGYQTLSQTDKNRLCTLSNAQVERCITLVIRDAKKKYGVPKNTDTELLDAYAFYIRNHAGTYLGILEKEQAEGKTG